MPSLNNVQIMGHLGTDPEVRSTAGGSAVCNLRIATTEKWTKDGQQHEKTEWHRVVVWGAQADNCGKYLRKGSLTYIEGSLETREWTDKEGVKRYTTEIKARRVLFLERKGSDEGSSGARTERQEHRQQQSGSREQRSFDDDRNIDDVPF